MSPGFFAGRYAGHHCHRESEDCVGDTNAFDHVNQVLGRPHSSFVRVWANHMGLSTQRVVLMGRTAG